jgi:hypothetical protein
MDMFVYTLVVGLDVHGYGVCVEIATRDLREACE